MSNVKKIALMLGACAFIVAGAKSDRFDPYQDLNQIPYDPLLSELFQLEVGLINGWDMSSEGRGCYPIIGSIRDSFLQMMVSSNCQPTILEYTSPRVEKYASQFPEIGLQYLLAGGNISDLKAVYENSSRFDFRHYCRLAFCLQNFEMDDSFELPSAITPSKVKANLSAEIDKGKIKLELTLENKSRIKESFLSKESLTRNIKISRSDGVPVYDMSPLAQLYMHGETDIKLAGELAMDHLFDQTVLQPNSSLIRSEDVELRVYSFNHPRLIWEIYLNSVPVAYRLFDTIVSGPINDSIELELRYIYDSILFDEYMIEQGVYRRGKRVPFRISSNAIYLKIGENGKVLSVRKEEEGAAREEEKVPAIIDSEEWEARTL